MEHEFEPACRRIEWLDPFYKAVWEKAFADSIPITGTFELTPRCNFNCKMCYVHLPMQNISQFGRELSAREWIKIASEAREAGTTWLCITGGEPFLHPEFETIYRELSQMGFFITLQTNASLIQGGVEKLLEEYPPRCVKITLYGSDDDVYEKVCQVKKGFTSVDKGIQKLKQMNIPIQLVSTIIQQNKDDVKRMAFYAFKNQLSWMPTNEIKHSVRGTDVELESLKIRYEDNEAWKKQMRIRMEKGINMTDRKPCTYCKDYRLGYWVMWNGEMRFCSFMDKPNISVLENGFESSWNQLIAYEESLKWPKECYTCKANTICLKCAGTLNAECGAPDKVTKEYCDKYIKFIECQEEI